MISLRLEAPFAAFRTFTAGSFRPTAGFITHSAAYGLLLNVAGIEMRHDDGKSPTTLIKKDLPSVRIALGAVDFPSQHTLFQQLHNYPVGADAGKKYIQGSMGNKYNITPVRRAFLSNVKAVIAIDKNKDLEDIVVEGLAGKSQRKYGLPFLGDSNFLVDRLDKIDSAEKTYWYIGVEGGDDDFLKERITRMTITIDRADMSKTRSNLFAPVAEPTKEIPEKAWVEVGY